MDRYSLDEGNIYWGNLKKGNIEAGDSDNTKGKG